jgi:hypothetical protein
VQPASGSGSKQVVEQAPASEEVAEPWQYKLRLPYISSQLEALPLRRACCCMTQACKR